MASSNDVAKLIESRLSPARLGEARKKKPQIKFGRMEKVDSHSGSIEITVDGKFAGEIIKNHGDLPGALSSVDTPGPVEDYEAQLNYGRGDKSEDKTFPAKGNARRALKAAKDWSREMLTKWHAEEAA